MRVSVGHCQTTNGFIGKLLAKRIREVSRCMIIGESKLEGGHSNIHFMLFVLKFRCTHLKSTPFLKTLTARFALSTS